MADESGSGAQPGTGAPAAGEGAPAGGPAPGGQQQAAVTERPAGVPEKFWDPAKGELRTDALVKGYGELEKLVGRRQEEARAAAEKTLFGNRPASAAAYEIRPPAEAPEGLLLLEEPPGPDFKAPEGKTVMVLDKADPLYGMARDLAYRAGMSQEEFSGLIGQYAQMQVARQPTAAQIAAERDRFYGELGEHGRERANYVWGQAKQLIGEKALSLDGVVHDRATFEAIESLITRATGATFAPINGAGAGSRVTQAELDRMVADPRYRTDPEFQARVTRGFEQLYAATPAGVPNPFGRG
ncbi:hypothetical protein M0638_12565 [Roseomonas sp. NAR14]|uniref:Uncharacterized protein n=1 Tax=Roseomonas acroporae TaxID=2937791 RepID=A0A9X2BU11_9PROT|nr:hypothetical protein [Roseomonas acroporae]MCK8785218.1 hypothetical protein [Roseomonas acroporae]